MPNAAIIVLAGTETADGLGRIVNAMEATSEFLDNEDAVELILDGAGVQWIPALEDKDHPYHAHYQSVKHVVSVCDYCTNAYDVEDPVEESGVERLDEYEGHPSIHALVSDGYEIITF